jgi:DNA-binding IclR family transcriptional regulator
LARLQEIIYQTGQAVHIKINERKEHYYVAQVMDLEKVRSEEDTATGRCLLCKEQEKETRLLLKCTKTQRRREELLQNKRPNMTHEIAFW